SPRWERRSREHAMNTVAITGANVGIGFGAARQLAADPDWHVVLACRDMGKASAAIATIRSRTPAARVTAMKLELYSPASVREFAENLAAAGLPPLRGLILNAGGINMRARAPEFTEDGFERTFQLNFLGHFALANLLLPHLAARSRIVSVTSDLHDPAATRMG